MRTLEFCNHEDILGDIVMSDKWGKELNEE